MKGSTMRKTVATVLLTVLLVVGSSSVAEAKKKPSPQNPASHSWIIKGPPKTCKPWNVKQGRVCIPSSGSVR